MRVMPSSQTFLRASAVVLTTLLAATGSGCVAVVPYSADTGKVAELGREDAEARLSEIIARSTNPQYAGATVQKGSFTAKQKGVMVGAFWTQHHYTNDVQIYFNNITDVEVYENNVVYVRGPGGSIDLRASFPDRQSATEFVDLVLSFQMAADSEDEASADESAGGS